MGKTFIKGLFLVFLSLFVIATASAQTITVGAVDPGPYGRGSSITVPFKVTGCITNPANVYRLYLSDAAGSFGSQILIGSKTGFYATFVNGVIPNGVTAGGNYKVRISASATGGTSAPSAIFSINAVTGIKAGMTSPQILNPAVDTEVFGQCAGSNKTFNFTNTSDFNTPATATFFNELTQTNEGAISLDGSFAATTANYTIAVKTQLAGIVGTKSYELINNVANNSFTITGNGIVCLGTGDALEYNVDITGPNGIQKNYPGLRYNISWGDNANSNYTLCEIVAANGKVAHPYSTSSCGSNPNNQKNVFQIDIQPTSPYCTNITQTVTTYAKVLAPATNSFTAPVAACVGSPTTFTNTSKSGDDPNSNAADCQNLNGKYSWYVDGVLKQSGYSLTQPFVFTFTTNGNHNVTIHFENNTGLCDAEDVTQTICVQNPPISNFTIPATYCLSAGALTPVNTSVVDEICNANTTYTWKQVSGPVGGVTFNASAKVPQFNFNAIGVYRFQLDITTLSCGPESSPIKEIVVNTTPTAVLSDDATQCGKGVTLTFDPNAGSTKTVFDGTAQALPATYTWTVTSTDGGTYTFASGSTANSQYPSIIFNDYATYNVTATHINNCGGPVNDTQVLTFIPAPTVSTGNPQQVCEGIPVSLSGTPGVGGLVTGVRWISTTGGTFSTPNAPNTNYTPSAVDINAGGVTLTYEATTSVASPCNVITSTVTIIIIKKATVTSTNTASVCGGTNFHYTITAADPATTFNWTAALTSGTATGFGASGSGNTINDLITNSGNTNAIVTYTITPTLNGCPGTPFTLTLTVNTAAVGGVTSGTDLVCAGSNNGQVTLTGQVGTIMWQRSVDGGATWANVAPAQTSAVLTYTNITQTTQYRAEITNGACGTAYSTITTITVNTPVPTADAGTYAPLCNQPSTTLTANNPAPFAGEWAQVDGPAANILTPNNFQTQVTGLIAGNIYKFRWTIKATAPCVDSWDEVTITDNPDVTADFIPSQKQACGPTEITFTNTSAPVFPGIVYEWNFGDGSPVSNSINPSHTFQPATDGRDITYIVSLTVVNNCVVRQPATVSITVSPAQPDARINPKENRACGILNLTVQNLSPGTNDGYIFYLIDENNTEIARVTKTNNDISDAVFPTINPDHVATWRLYMEAKDKCGNINRSPEFQIPVSPSNINSNMQIKDNPAYVCLGTPVFFRNLSAGGDAFIYTIYDENKAIITSFPGGLADLSYTFPNVGSYFVSITASNTGCGDAPPSDLIPIQVYPLPTPQFTYTTDVNNKVTFMNTTPAAGNTPAASLTYVWNFGDGTAPETSFTPNDHTFDYTKSPYTVSLTARNPGTTCEGVITHTIEIKFTGELFLPNAFQPASSKDELRTFKAKGQKLKEWRMQIFNNWGQLIWQTTQLNSNGEPVEGWDGTFKGSPAQQGTYIWQITAKFLNGSDWKGMSFNGSLPKRSGVIHLIR